MKRLLVIAAASAIASGSGLAATAIAAPPSPASPAGHSSDIRGIVHAKHEAGRPGGSGGNLSYHGGPVMHTNQTYAIYWGPNAGSNTFSANYASTINGFLTNVGAVSGATTNVYFSDTQYTDGSGPISYSSHFAGSVTDTSAYPTSGCSDTVAATNVCLSDAQIQAEVQRIATLNGWNPSADNQSMFFVFTAKNVGSCFDASHCAFSYYCAYHGDFTGTNGVHYIYANQPYTNTAPSSCGTGQAPNDADADSTINVTSHEHNEAITDPDGNAWFDRKGAENGDKCAWNFGTALGGASGAKYNQVINGAHYYLQQEWSNARSGCVLTGT